MGKMKRTKRKTNFRKNNTRRIKSKMIKSNRIKSKRIKSKKIKSRKIKSRRRRYLKGGRKSMEFIKEIKNLKVHFSNNGIILDKYIGNLEEEKKKLFFNGMFEVILRNLPNES